MPDSCAAVGCSSERNAETKSRGITFHRFPKDITLRTQWERAVKRRGFVASERSLLCSEHFKADDFDRTGQIVRLRHGVEPSIFSFSSNLQKVQPRTTRNSRKTEERPAVVPPQPLCEAKPQYNVDHSYALPASPVALKARLNAALARVESLEHARRNCMIRERRAKKNLDALLEELRETNLINEELRQRLEGDSEMSFPSSHLSRRSFPSKL
ncbi:THAP domain-containing protein 6-like isoform 1-T1 [Synchiropus picturatus]